jgi:hypothetical protein
MSLLPGTAAGAGPLIWLLRGSNGHPHACVVSASTLMVEWYTMLSSFSNPLVRHKENSFSVQIFCRVRTE